MKWNCDLEFWVDFREDLLISVMLEVVGGIALALENIAALFMI